MIDGERFSDPRFLQGSVKTYRKAIRLMSDCWEKVTGEALEVDSGPPKDAFLHALAQFEARLSIAHADEKERVKQTLQNDIKEWPAEVDLINSIRDTSPGERNEALDRDMDLVPPRLCLDIMRDVASSLAKEGNVTTLPLRTYLVEVMKALAPKMGWKRPLNVGDNRHFPRTWQWFSELSESSWTEYGYGIRPVNVRGPAPAFPNGPGELRVRIDPCLL